MKPDDLPRIDQESVMPKYPMFEDTQKDKKLPYAGWGIDRLKLKYKTVKNQKLLSNDREHVKYFDLTKPSKFNGYPGGFNAATHEN